MSKASGFLAFSRSTRVQSRAIVRRMASVCCAFHSGALVPLVVSSPVLRARQPRCAKLNTSQPYRPLGPLFPLGLAAAALLNARAAAPASSLRARTSSGARFAGGALAREHNPSLAARSPRGGPRWTATLYASPCLQSRRRAGTPALRRARAAGAAAALISHARPESSRQRVIRRWHPPRRSELWQSNPSYGRVILRLKSNLTLIHNLFNGVPVRFTGSTPKMYRIIMPPTCHCSPPAPSPPACLLALEFGVGEFKPDAIGTGASVGAGSS